MAKSSKPPATQAVVVGILDEFLPENQAADRLLNAADWDSCPQAFWRDIRTLCWVGGFVQLYKVRGGTGLCVAFKYLHYDFKWYGTCTEIMEQMHPVACKLDAPGRIAE